MRKALFLTLSICIASIQSYAQKADSIASHSFRLFAGISRHGTNDVMGYAVGFVCDVQSRKRIDLGFSLTQTVHDGSIPVRYNPDSNAPVQGVYKEGELGFVTAGTQLEAYAGLKLLERPTHLLKIGAGVLVRYQTTSFPDYAFRDFYINEYFSEPRHRRTIAAGLPVFANYNMMISDEFFIGVEASLQYDSNEDALTRVGISLGRKFK